jgi:hypothetical protein
MERVEDKINTLRCQIEEFENPTMFPPLPKPLFVELARANTNKPLMKKVTPASLKPMTAGKLTAGVKNT